MLKTVRLDHLRAALLAVAAAGLLAAVGLLVVVLYAQPAEANYPGKPGKIVFSGYDGANKDYEIYTINPNGGSKKQLTDNSTEDRYPSYSPSGKKIAYRGYDDGTVTTRSTPSMPEGEARNNSPTIPRATAGPLLLAFR